MVREIGLALGTPIRVHRARMREQLPSDPHHRGRALLAEEADLLARAWRAQWRASRGSRTRGDRRQRTLRVLRRIHVVDVLSRLPLAAEVRHPEPPLRL